MKKIVTIISLIMLFIPMMFANAASVCSYKEQTEINKKIANIKVNYEITNEDYTSITGKTSTISFINISIVNLSEEFYIIATNDTNDEEKTFTIDDVVDGVINYRWDDFEKVTKFSFEIYTNSLTSCPDEKYKTVYLLTPRFNSYSKRDTCADNEDFEWCKKFTTNPNDISEDKFLEKIESFTNSKKEKEPEKEPVTNEKNILENLLDLINKYQLYIGIVGVAIVGGLIAFKIIQSKKKTKDLDL